jgi:membrane-associated phospholipid phosphatase
MRRTAHGRATRWAIGITFVCALGALSPAARADEPTTPPPASPPLRWDPAWTHANAWDYSLAGVGAFTLGAEAILLQGRSEPPRWIGPILFDTQLRSIFRMSTVAERANAADVSWVLWFALVGYPLVVDIPHAWVRYGKQVAWDLFWQDATALSLSAAFDFALRDTVARVRPYNTDCLAQGGNNCNTGPEWTRSFPSGHVSETTTATALICTQHLTMHLYGAPWDGVTCASAVTADATVAVLRMMADDHWATDILGGAALGFAFGWGVPVLMHLHGHTTPAPATGSMPMLVAPVPITFIHGGGLGVTGLF